MIIKSTPPGFTTDPWASLGMSRQNFYQTGLISLWQDGPLSAYQTRPNTPILYATEEVGIVRYWLLVRQGLIALGLLPATAPIKPERDILAWFEEDEYGADCPQCGGSAVEDLDTGRVWCPACGIIKEE